MQDICYDTRDNLPIPSSKFVDPAKLPSYRNELEKGMLALLGKFYQFRDFLALVQPRPRETRQYRLFFLGHRNQIYRFKIFLLLSRQFNSSELRQLC